MEGKNLQARILYPARLSFRFDGEIKRFQISKIKRVLHHQTSFTTNAKGTSLGRKMQRRKRPTENKPKTIRKMVMGPYVSIITLNANGLNAPTKRQIGWVDTKTRSMYMLSTRDPPRTYRHLQTESKGMGEGISHK